MSSAQQTNHLPPGTQISLVGSQAHPQVSNIHLQNHLTPQHLAALQNQHQLNAQFSTASGVRPSAVINLNQPIAGLQNVQVLGSVAHNSNASLPMSIISSGGQTFVQAAPTSQQNSIQAAATANHHMQVRAIAPNTAIVNQQLQAVQQLRNNLPTAASLHQAQVLDNTVQSSSTSSSSSASGTSSVLNKRKLQDLLREIDPLETMDDDAEEVLLQLADDFLENIITSSCQIAKNRKSSTLDVKDIQLHLDRNWNMWIPGFGNEDLRPYKKLPSTEAHRQRLTLIKKALKK